MSRVLYRPTIAVDFDGVIHRYSEGWKDGSIYDPPMEDAIGGLIGLMDRGYTVYVLTTRSPRETVRWLKEREPFHRDSAFSSYGVQVVPFWKKFWDKPYVLGVTNRKLPAKAFIDDRAYHFGECGNGESYCLENWCEVLKTFLPSIDYGTVRDKSEKPDYD